MSVERPQSRVVAVYKLDGFERPDSAWLLFLPEGRAPASKVVLSYDEWVELGRPESLTLSLEAAS